VPFRPAQLPSFRAKKSFSIQLADLPIQKIDLSLSDGSLGPPSKTLAAPSRRFARNSRDWQQLIEMCRVVDTVLMTRKWSTRRAKATIDCCSA